MSNKKRATENMELEERNSASDSADDDVDPEIYTGNEVSLIEFSVLLYNHINSLRQEIQVDFEGRNPIDSDYHGIRQLLLQLFLKSHINVNELTDLIIGQNYIGSVIKQCEVDDESDDDDAPMEESDPVFGITTAINLSNKPDVECIKQLRALLLEKVEQFGTDATIKLVRDILGNDSKPVALLINERFVNIPAQIAIPMMENLQKEIKRADDKKMPYNFGYYIMVVKFYRKEAKKKKPAETLYTNHEEEIICEKSLASFEFSVANEADSGMTGNWLEDDSCLVPYRRIIVFDGKNLPDIVSSVKAFVNGE
jgi:protein BCP1